MDTPVDEVLQKAETRAREAKLPYRGALTPQEAWALVQEYPGAKLVDVRTEQERQSVGRIPGAISIEWKRAPDFTLNPEFVSEAQATLGKTDFLLLICRSAVRSHEAAAKLANAGFANAFNVLEGFEGGRNAKLNHSGAGWKAAGLPWAH